MTGSDDVRRFSHSELKTFLRCRRKWWLQYVRRLRKFEVSPVGALQTGTRLHLALQAMYTPGGCDDPRGVLENAIKADGQAYMEACAKTETPVDDAVLKQLASDADLERAMLEGYVEWLEETGADSGLTIVAAEATVSVPIDRIYGPITQAGFPHAEVVGKLDARVVRERDGARLFIDHKTTASLTQPLPTLARDTQMLHYHLLEVVSDPDGERCDGALYNMLRKVKRTKTAKPPFFAREEVRHNDHEIGAYQRRMLQIISDIVEVERDIAAGAPSIAYPNPTRDCAWDCDFFVLCPMFDDGSRAEDMIADRYRVHDPMQRYTDPD